MDKFDTKRLKEIEKKLEKLAEKRPEVKEMLKFLKSPEFLVALGAMSVVPPPPIVVPQALATAALWYYLRRRMEKEWQEAAGEKI